MNGRRLANAVVGMLMEMGDAVTYRELAIAFQARYGCKVSVFTYDKYHKLLFTPKARKVVGMATPPANEDDQSVRPESDKSECAVTKGWPCDGLESLPPRQSTPTEQADWKLIEDFARFSATVVAVGGVERAERMLLLLKGLKERI